MKKNLEYLYKKKCDGVPITMLTAYDFPTAKIADEASVDAILIGDSVGTNVLGFQSEREVRMYHMVHHTAAVSRAVENGFILADMPFGSADVLDLALQNARLLIDQGANCVKIEGWQEKVPIFQMLKEEGIPVCAHIGYNPQIHDGKPRTFGLTAKQASELIESAIVLQNAGAALIVLEKISSEVAALITKKLTIPVIGIGCGSKCDGQVLVMHDVLGFTSRTFRHSHRYLDFYTLGKEAILKYCNDVVTHQFPAEENTWHMPLEEEKNLDSFS